MPLLKALLAVAVVCLVACGGGGGGSPAPSAPSPPPPPPPPVGSGGCSVTVGAGPFNVVWPSQGWQNATPASQGLCPDAIETAMDYAFREDNYTGAVLVAKNGYLVAERYADDRAADDLATSWSVAKSFTSALVGAAVDDGLIGDIRERKVADFAPDAFSDDWRNTDKAEISIWHLTNLRTGLEVLSGALIYDARDQLALAMNRRLIGRPGEKLYDYSNADVMIAGTVIEGATGMPAPHYFADRVGTTIGFQGDWWQDSAGNAMTYCCLDATPRDFLRFGLLYARRGEWNGTRVISTDWIATSTAPALRGEYAFYWWSAPPQGKGFTAIGLNGQIVAVYPDEDLVVARFSRYRRMGDGHPVKDEGNYHETFAPAAFDNGTFLSQVFEAVQ